MENAKFEKLTAENFNISSLDNFERYQNVKKCWRRSNGEYALTEVRYTEDWNLSELRAMAKKIISATSRGCLAFGAVFNGTVIGFALIDNCLFGSRMQYVDLEEFYVSSPYRNCGIGKKLFELSCRAAKDMGAKKLYVSAHSAEDSIAAYKSYGCVLAKEINKELAEKEPFDLQLECDLRIYKVSDKRKYMPLFLLADEQESMIERYLGDGITYIMEDGEVIGEITVLETDETILEIKSLAVYPKFQKKGFGRELIEYVCRRYQGEYKTITVGTGDSPLTVPFYEKCGFVIFKTVKNFFTDNYDHPIIECGKELRDMIYLKRKL